MEYRTMELVIFVAYLFFANAAPLSENTPSNSEMEFVKNYERTRGRWPELESFDTKKMSSVCKRASELPGMEFVGKKLFGKILVVIPIKERNYKTEVTFKTDVLACTLGDKYRYIFYVTKARETDQLFMLMKKRRNRATVHQKIDMRPVVTNSNQRMDMRPMVTNINQKGDIRPAVTSRAFQTRAPDTEIIDDDDDYDSNNTVYV